MPEPDPTRSVEPADSSTQKQTLDLDMGGGNERSCCAALDGGFCLIPFHPLHVSPSRPGMDGVEFVRHLARIGSRGGLVLVSGEDARILQTV